MSQKFDLWVNSSVDSLVNAGDNSGENYRPDDLITLWCNSLAVLWKDWPKQMELTELEIDSGKFSLRGNCPHCQLGSVFTQVTSVHARQLTLDHQRLAVGMQCQGCLEYILAVALKSSEYDHPSKLDYIKHYPLGKPDDSIDENTKEPMASNFSEAIRCLWVDAHKASVAMCRRAVEASCNDLGARGKNLKRKINDLAQRRLITESLQQMAHAVRITANEELHGNKQTSEKTQEAKDVASGDPSKIEIVTSDLDTFSKDDAKAIIKFTEQFFHHVYVMPALLKKYIEPKGEASEESS